MNAKERAEKLHRKTKTFVLSCVDADGYPMTKAVVPGKYKDSINEIYFCTNTSSRFASVVSLNPKSGVYFYSRKLIVWRGCYLRGEMEIVTDMAVKQKYWQWMYRNAYAEKSYTDPDFCVLKFTPTVGRLYANFDVKDFKI